MSSKLLPESARRTELRCGRLAIALSLLQNIYHYNRGLVDTEQLSTNPFYLLTHSCLFFVLSAAGHRAEAEHRI